MQTNRSNSDGTLPRVESMNAEVAADLPLFGRLQTAEDWTFPAIASHWWWPGPRTPGRRTLILLAWEGTCKSEVEVWALQQLGHSPMFVHVFDAAERRTRTGPLFYVPRTKALWTPFSVLKLSHAGRCSESFGPCFVRIVAFLFCGGI